MNYAKITTRVLITTILIFISMIPGGPIETRSFANMNPTIALGFNTFLALLLITSIITVYFMIQKQILAYYMTGALGFIFMLIFILDLAKIFPVSPNPMETPLYVLELVSLVLGAMLMALSYKTISATAKSYWSKVFKTSIVLVIIVILLLVISIYGVYFATSSALN